MMLLFQNHNELQKAAFLSNHYFLIKACACSGLPRCHSGREPACQCRRHRRRGFDPWVGKSPREQGVATHSSILAWRIPWAEEPGGLQSMGSQTSQIRPRAHVWTDSCREAAAQHRELNPVLCDDLERWDGRRSSGGEAQHTDTYG